jgi:hypothetical protein
LRGAPRQQLADTRALAAGRFLFSRVKYVLDALPQLVVGGLLDVHLDVRC